MGELHLVLRFKKCFREIEGCLFYFLLTVLEIERKKKEEIRGEDGASLRLTAVRMLSRRVRRLDRYMSIFAASNRICHLPVRNISGCSHVCSVRACVAFCKRLTN